MSNDENISLGNGILAALKVGTANAVSVVTRPVYTAQLILGIKTGKNVSEMLLDELPKRKVKVLPRR